VDTHLRSGDVIPPYYDSMIAKLIVSGPTREAAVEKLAAVLPAVEVRGVTTNLGLHRRIAAWDAFRTGRYDTRSLEAFVAGRS
jgi:acetyl-CoA carboxylase biotin carboxylase subunit